MPLVRSVDRETPQHTAEPVVTVGRVRLANHLLSEAQGQTFTEISLATSLFKAQKESSCGFNVKRLPVRFVRKRADAAIEDFAARRH